MKVLKFSRQGYFDLIEELARIVNASGFKPDQIVGIATGGLIPAMVLSKLFDIPLAILSVESYAAGEAGDGVKNQEGGVTIGSLATSRAKLGRRVLLVDDLTDRGETLRLAKQWFIDHYGQEFDELRTVTIWHKTRSHTIPDFFVQAVGPYEEGKWPWIIQPLEVYETKELRNEILGDGQPQNQKEE